MKRIHSYVLAVSAALALVLAALTAGASARDDDPEHPHDVRQELQALKAQVQAIQATVASLQDQLAAVQANHALALDPFVSVDPNPQRGVAGPNITFSGANLHLVSGSGSTNEGNNPRGLGNLIIGYDEEPPLTFPLRPGDRGGSHNLVIGRSHRFTRAAFGGLVVGESNTISDWGASVSGGEENTASGFCASVSGGDRNAATGLAASVSGGLLNTASAATASVSGGGHNTASGGGASVTGGLENTASGPNTIVIGGSYVSDNKVDSIAPNPPFP